MSYYENNFIEQNNATYNNLEEGYDNDNFYYLTDAEQQVSGLDENMYIEDNYVEHMESPRQEQVITQVPALPVPTVVPTQVKDKKEKKVKKDKNLNWLYILVVILVIALIAYYLIDKKIISIPSLTSSSTASPSISSFNTNTLGSTFMSLH